MEGKCRLDIRRLGQNIILENAVIIEYLSLEFLQSFCHYIGLVGFLLYMVGFAGLQLQYLDGNGYLYVIINFFAALFVLIGLSFEFNIASALIQISWIIISIVGIGRKMMKQNVRKLSGPTAFAKETT